MNNILLTAIVLAFLTVNADTSKAHQMYIKKSIGHNFTTKSPHFKIGVGYTSFNNIRNDITFSFSEHKKVNKYKVSAQKGIVPVNTCTITKQKNSTIIKSLPYKEKKFGIMANGYYDFNNVTGYLPYVMAGIGVNRTISVDKDSINYRTNLAYQFGAGLGYKLNENIILDTEYKVLGETKKYKKGFPVLHQTLFTGARFVF